MQKLALDLPAGYYLERDPDVLVLRRVDGSVAGTFSARGAAPDAVRQLIEETEGRGLSAYLPHSPPREEPSLRVFFFGKFEMLCDGNAIRLGRNGKALTILKYLLANRSRPVSQDHLMGWLWPESNLKKARWSLNSAIHGLRKLLGGCSPSLSTDYVTLDDGYYQLSPAVRVWTDVEEFDACCEKGRRLEKQGSVQEAVLEYERAVALYRGDYLIEDLYEDWTMVEREHLSNAYMDMLGKLAAHHMETGQYWESIRGCYKVLEKELCHEGSYRLLMHCYARLGLRGRALEQYRICEKILEDKYGMMPSSETRAVYASILKHRSV